MTAYGVIFARGGSKGVPGKNLRQVGGRSLLAHAIMAGRGARWVDQVMVSTDSDEIIAEARQFGAEVPFRRPSRLAQDHSPEWESWQHIARHLLGQGASESDLLVSLPTTSPLRITRDVDDAVQTFRDGSFDLVLAITESKHSPWFNMVSCDASGRVELAFSGAENPVTRRQDAPKLFDVTTVVYVTSLGFVIRGDGVFTGNIGAVKVPSHRAVDIDTPLDLDIADYLMTKKARYEGGQ